ncbi:M23 family metallopeptidase [Kribbella sandramycini]|uniref:M23 family metallopeptidase n=1 Tax=Kribbella sandramycini TaxID=60450 RepID=A0A7Y4L2G5_9ACTN|nr:M23 family metallopeptidase [Kribbella sandramycini]MBB6566193.1 hypothetical protein [Kribbella sandramycini]NOL43140.1 M23 family metallopeptidase [Kribbella sandramycini]
MKLIRLALLASLAATGLYAVPSAASVTEEPIFQMPVPCGETWTMATHSGHNPPEKIDMINNAGRTHGAPALASAAGTVTVSGFAPDAGNMVVIDHGFGWKTRYLHLDTRTVAVGNTVALGAQIGTVGNTGTNTSGSHLHYEQITGTTVRQPKFRGIEVPRKWQYFQYAETSENCSGPVETKFWVDTFQDAPGYAAPGVNPSTGTLKKGTSYVYCRVEGPVVRVGNSFNKWWLQTDLDVGPRNQFVSAYYLSRWGNDEAKDNAGRDIKDCPAQ